MNSEGSFSSFQKRNAETHEKYLSWDTFNFDKYFFEEKKNETKTMWKINDGDNANEKCAFLRE